MRDFKAIKTLTITVLAGLLIGVAGLVVPRPAQAVVIEGMTPTGQFRAVFITAEGRLPITGSTSTVLPIVFVDSQPVNAFQATIPWEVVEDISNTTLETGDGTITPGSSPALVWPTESTRKASSFCNTDLFINIFFGGIVGTQLKVLPPGACLNPDAPPSYTGPLYIRSTATATYDWFKIKP